MYPCLALLSNTHRKAAMFFFRYIDKVRPLLVSDDGEDCPVFATSTGKALSSSQVSKIMKSCGGATATTVRKAFARQVNSSALFFGVASLLSSYTKFRIWSMPSILSETIHLNFILPSQLSSLFLSVADALHESRCSSKERGTHEPHPGNPSTLLRGRCPSRNVPGGFF